MEILSIAIQKGGTGKTTTAAALAQAGAMQGQRVLAIDLDPQGNYSFALGAETGGTGSYELLTGTDPAELIQHSPQGMDIIPANMDLATITSSRGSARRLQAALTPLKRSYDLIVIDTPPTAGELQYNALMAATGLIIPLQADIYNLQGLYQMADTARQIQNSNPALQIRGIVLTQFDPRSTLSKQMRDTITEKASELDIPLLGVIRSGIAVKEAAALQQSLFSYARKSKPAADYMALYEALQIEGGQE